MPDAVQRDSHGVELIYSNAMVISMTEFDATVRKVGDSMGILIPHQVVVRLKARPGTRLHVVVPEKVDWSRIWGKFSSQIPTGELLAQARTERD